MDGPSTADHSLPRASQRLLLWPLLLVVTLAAGLTTSVLRWRLGSTIVHGFAPLYPLLQTLLLLALVSLSPDAFGMRLGNHRRTWWLYLVWLAVEAGYIVAWRLLEPSSRLFGWQDPSRVLVVPLHEEFLFRGLFYAALVSMYPSSEAGGKLITKPVLFTALLFALWHLEPFESPGWWRLLVRMGFTFVAGLAYGVMRRRSGSVLGPIAMHMAWNFMASI
jgi:membrane protease YdiL (CAAX protease family)